ncbi:MAG TPA: hypothetical protein VNO32_23675 [Candidatus Acidoferrum sp.]|nr:hypothetical protein [Candidatus Acidoferrum sp.]
MKIRSLLLQAIPPLVGGSSFVLQPPDQVDPGTADAMGFDLRREGEQSPLLAGFQLHKPHTGYRRNLKVFQGLLSHAGEGQPIAGAGEMAHIG